MNSVTIFISSILMISPLLIQGKKMVIIVPRTIRRVHTSALPHFIQQSILKQQKQLELSPSYHRQNNYNVPQNYQLKSHNAQYHQQLSHDVNYGKNHVAAHSLGKDKYIPHQDVMINNNRYADSPKSLVPIYISPSYLNQHNSNVQNDESSEKTEHIREDESHHQTNEFQMQHIRQPETNKFPEFLFKDNNFEDYHKKVADVANSWPPGLNLLSVPSEFHKGVASSAYNQGFSSLESESDTQTSFLTNFDSSFSLPQQGYAVKENVEESSPNFRVMPIQTNPDHHPAQIPIQNFPHSLSSISPSISSVNQPIPGYFAFSGFHRILKQ